MTAVILPVAGLARTLDGVSAADAGQVGGKAANLGELIGAGFPVPPGFVIPASRYLESMAQAGVRQELAGLYDRALAADPAHLDEHCARMAAMVRRAGVHPELAAAVQAVTPRCPTRPAWAPPSRCGPPRSARTGPTRPSRG